MHFIQSAFVAVWLLGCSDDSASQQPKQKDKPSVRQFGHSFNVILAAADDGSFKVNGYSEYVESRSQAMALGAVLVVGVQDGVTLGDKKFELGDVVVVEGTADSKTFRLATPDDKIVLRSSVEAFGQEYKKGAFKVPKGGNLKKRASDAQPSVTCLFAKRALNYQWLDGLDMVPKNPQTDVVLVLRIQGASGNAYVMAGKNKYQSPNAFLPIGKPWIELNMIVPKDVLEFKLFVDDKPSITIKADDKVLDELKQTVD